MIPPFRPGTLLAAWLLFVTFLILPPIPHAHASELTEHYRRALAADPADESLRYHFGICLLNDGNDRAGVAELLKVYPAFAGSLEANYNLGLGYTRLGDPDNALLYLELAEGLGALDQPDLYPLTGLYYNIALLYNDRELPEEAIRLLERVLVLDPRQQAAQRLLADVLARNDQIDKAQTVLHRYLELFPQDEQMRDYLFALYFNRALAAMDGGRNDEARRDFTAALNIDPDSIYAGYYLGYLDYQAGQHAAAAAALIKIAPKAPPHLTETLPPLLYNCALALLDQKQPEAAESIAAYLLALPTPSVRDLFLAGNIRLALKDFPAAGKYYREILAREPGHHGAATNLLAAESAQAAERMRKGQEHFRNEEYRPALALFEQVLAFNTSYPLAKRYAEESRRALTEQATALFAEAEAAKGQGALTEALQLVNRGLDLTPGNPRGKLMQRELQEQITNEIESRFTLAGQLLQRQDFVAAEGAYRALGELAPDDPRIAAGIEKALALRTAAASAALAEGEQALAKTAPDAAEQAFAKALALLPDHQPAHAGRERARALRKQLIERELRDGRRLFADGDHALGRKAFARALALHDDPLVREELKGLEAARDQQIKSYLAAAQSLLAKNEFKKCRGQLAQAAAVAPSDPQLLKLQKEYDNKLRDTVDRTLASAREKLKSGNARGALKDFRTVLEYDPGNTLALRGMEQGKSQGQKELQQLVAAGSTALRGGEFDKAAEFYRKALDLDPYHAPARDGSEQVKQLRKDKTATSDANTLYLQGIDLYTKGAYEEAIGLWEKVLALAPRHEKAQMNIEKAKRKLRQIKEYSNG